MSAGASSTEHLEAVISENATICRLSDFPVRSLVIRQFPDQLVPPLKIKKRGLATGRFIATV